MAIFRLGQDLMDRPVICPSFLVCMFVLLLPKSGRQHRLKSYTVKTLKLKVKAALKTLQPPLIHSNETNISKDAQYG